MKRMLRICGASLFQLFVGMASWVGLTRIIASFGSEAVAGHNISVRIFISALLPSMGLGNAAATLVGQSLGAGKPDRAEAAVWRVGLFNFVFLSATGLIFAIFGREISSWFTSDPAALDYASASLRAIALGFPFYAYGMVLSQSFNGASDTRTPTLLNVAFLWLFELPLAL